jgi:DNA invertase Pin-like site-specific DNA recombinase
MKRETSLRSGHKPLGVAIVYGRYSDDEQGAGDSLRRQTEGAQKYAEAHDLGILMVLFDKGYSGYRGDNIKSGKLGELLQDIRDGKIKLGTVLLVESLDRLSREAPISQFLLLAEILNAGIEVVTFGDGKRYTLEAMNNNPHDLFGALGIMTRSNDEAKTKDDRHRKNWAAKRQQIKEKKLTARGPGWLKLNEKRSDWELIEERVKLVLRMFVMALAGMGTHMIAEQFNREGIKPWRGAKKWKDGTIRYILSSRAVIGEFQPCIHVDKTHRMPEGPLEADYFPRIIEPAVFERVNSVLRIQSGVSKNVSFLFAGLVFDGVSGERLTHAGYQYGSSRCGHAYLYHPPQKPSSGWDYNVFENSFLHHVNNLNWADLVVSPARVVNVSEKNRLEAEQARIKRILQRMTNMLTGEDSPPRTLIQEMKALELELAKVERKLAELDAEERNILKRQRNMKDAKKGFDELLKSNTREARLRLRFEIRTLVKRIDIWQNSAECAELQHLAPLIKVAMEGAEWKLKSDLAAWPCYRITFANGVVKWVLCQRISRRRMEPQQSIQAAQNSIVITPWDSFVKENGLL